MSEIERLRRLLAAVKSLPWRDVSDGEYSGFVTDDPDEWVVVGPSDDPESESETALIVAAVNALPALLDVAEAVRAWRAHLSIPMGPEQMLAWAETEYRLSEAIGTALARLDGAP